MPVQTALPELMLILSRPWASGPLRSTGCASGLVLESFDAALAPRPSPARPQTVKVQGAIEHALVDLACSDPPQGRSRWTLQLLTDQLVMLGTLPSVSLERCGRRSKKRDSTRVAENLVHSSTGGRR